MEYQEIGKTREYIRKAIEEGANFLFSVTGNAGVPAKKHDVKAPSIWTSAEMLEFLLINKVLPSYSIANTIDSMVDFLISKYDPSVSGWALTADDPPKAYSAITTGYCTYILKLYLNTYTTDARKEQLLKIINDAETSILAAQDSEKGFWIPKSKLKSVDTNMNYGKLFYSVHAYYGIKNVNGYINNNSFRVANARKMANFYFLDFANNLIDKAYSISEQDTTSQTTLLGHAANLIRVLSDIDPDGNAIIINKLYDVVKKFKDSTFTTTSVQIYELPSNAYNNFHLNVAYNVFLALVDSIDHSEEILEITNWYLKQQDPNLHCWYLGANRNSGIDTWSTCEALVILSYAHNYYFEKYYQSELAKIQKKHYLLDGHKKEQVEAVNFIAENVNLITKKIKTFAITSTIITIISVVCTVVALLVLSEISNNRWLNLFSTVIIIPAIYQIAASFKLPDLSDIDKVQEYIAKKSFDSDRKANNL